MKKAFQESVIPMTLKMHVLFCHLAHFLPSNSDFSDEAAER